LEINYDGTRLKLRSSRSGRIEFLCPQQISYGSAFYTPSRLPVRNASQICSVDPRANTQDARAAAAKVQVHCRRKGDGNARLILHRRCTGIPAITGLPPRTSIMRAKAASRRCVRGYSADPLVFVLLA